MPGKVKIHSVAEDEKRASKLVFEVKKISYKINDLELIKEFSMLILKGEKIGIIGTNPDFFLCEFFIKSFVG
jgi:ATP-binding cassette subfamily F protein uup